MTGSTDNFMDGTAHIVVQAGSVRGGVHIKASPEQPLPLPRQLPARPWLLVGRDDEAAALDEAIRTGDLFVAAIDGPGGIGKTTLVLEWAYRHLDRFPDGQLFADLGGFGKGEPGPPPLTVLRGFLAALGVPASAVPTDTGAASALFRSLLAGRRILIVLDNAAVAAQVVPLLPAAAPAAVVVTSRQHLAGLGAGRVRRIRLGVLDRAGSAALLTENLGESAAGVEPAALNVLIDHCGGLPLALSIVAARASRHPGHPLSTMIDELGAAEAHLSGFDAGTESMRLQSVFSWSTSRLTPPQARAFRLVGTAPVAPLGQHAAASLLGLAPRRATVLLNELERANLLEEPTPRRYLMHALLRRHAGELAEEDEPTADRVAAVRRLTDSYLGTAYQADRLLFPYRTLVTLDHPAPGVSTALLTDESAALAWFSTEYDQLLALHRHAEQLGWWRHVWLLARLLDTYQHRWALLRDNVDTSRRGVAAAHALADRYAISLAERQLGRALTHAQRYDDARRHLNLALQAADDRDDTLAVAHTRHDLARLSSLVGEHDAALRHAREALRLYRDCGDPVGEAHALNRAARQLAELGDHQAARTAAQQALALHERNSDPAGSAATLDNLGHIARLLEQPDEAIEHYSRALADGGANPYLEAAMVEHLGDAHAAAGDDQRAGFAWQHALTLYEAQFRTAEARRVSNRILGLGGP
ncbi:Regulatory protein AfsR [Micromonospora noduli]|uniref:Regulatory protein AfsR n=1 Tax=Micromonospora noduli TaxID=709876 RepID=A0ABX9D9C2_9ACTN|nr:tetratricopeptide repeat protein [Micromonospora noduli]RAO25168.1 Regulatory protein AfsR [Micromonospora noduli]